jgi:hypothetical protein
LERESYRKKYYGGTFRGVGPCNTYNCHGLTFASRRTAITTAIAVRAILAEDGYATVSRNDVLPGDIVVYYSTGELPGDVEHSGIVVERVSQQGLIGVRIKVLSKWGYCDEVVHFAEECPYDVGDIRYFRVNQ